MERTEGEILRRLHRGLRERRTPQEVAADLLELRAERWLSAAGTRDLYRIVRFAGASIGSSMAKTWRRHPGLGRSYEAAAVAVGAVCDTAGRPQPAAADPGDPVSLRRWLDAAAALLGLPQEPLRTPRSTVKRRPVAVKWGQWTFYRLPTPRGARGERGGHVDARERLDASARRERLPGVPVRAYRRAVRAVLHLQQRTEVLAAERDREAATAFGKSRLAHLVAEKDFVACPATAAFTAYYVARLNLRTVFTSGSQARPMDSLAEELLAAAIASPVRQPWVLASVLTRWSVLDLLDDVQCGMLMALYYEQFAAAARALRRTFDENRDSTQMIVRMGDDSSTWNAASRSFNQARTGWLNLLRGLGYEDVLEANCPGKVPALVAADVAAWHRLSGRDQHVDVRVWADLPLPWDVVLGDDDCPAELVRWVCARHGVDAEAAAWTQPYRQVRIELPEPAPDLVHGVAVGSPMLAGVLRRAGVFSGQL